MSTWLLRKEGFLATEMI